MSGSCPAVNETDLLRIVRGIRDLFQGRSDCAGSFTCTPNAGSTTVTAGNCGSGSKVVITPTTANAATEVGNGTIYVSAKAVGSFTVTHANAGTTGRTFDYRICS